MRIRFLFLLLFLIVGLNATTPTKDNIAKLYIATFDRAPDSAGLNYWLYNSGLDLEGIAHSFFDQPETYRVYGEVKDIDVFIVAIYDNLFKREADNDGYKYWKERLLDGTIAPSLFILAIMNGAQGNDNTILENKTKVGLAFANKGLSNVEDAKSIMSGVDASNQSKIDALNKFDLGEEEQNKEEVTTSSYVGSQNNTIFTNATTKLMWQNIFLPYMEKEEAIKECSNLSLAGYNDWRLPTLAESKHFHFNMNIQGDIPVESDFTAEIASDGYVRTKSGASQYGDEIGDPIGFKGGANVRCVRVDDGSTPAEENNNEAIKSVLDKHNAIRQELYSGANMSWSKEIALSAQAYANVLATNGIMKHDDSNKIYGENLAISTTNMSYTAATNEWYKEKNSYDYNSNSCIDGICGHYTQIIWKGSTQLGCGSAIIKTGKFENGVVVVCRYNPTGNWIGDKPY